jgi:hypothetical protein
VVLQLEKPFTAPQLAQALKILLKSSRGAGATIAD